MSSRPALGSNQPPIQWVQGLFPRGYSGRGVNLTTHLQLVPRSRKRGSIHPLTYTPSWRSSYLVKHRENFTFTCISTTYIITLPFICLLIFFLSFSSTFCFTNSDYRLIPMTSSPNYSGLARVYCI
jgi:hypothetical protein